MIWLQIVISFFFIKQCTRTAAQFYTQRIHILNAKHYTDEKMSAVSIEHSTNNVNFIILTSCIFNCTVGVMHEANSVCRF